MTRAKVSEVWDAVVDAGALSPTGPGCPVPMPSATPR